MTSGNAPDGGPQRRRPADPELAVAELVADLQDKHNRLASDVSEVAAGLQDEVQRAMREVAALGGTVSNLAQTVADVLGEPATNPATVDWFTLDRSAAKDAWDGLLDWLTRFYVPTFAPTRFEIPDCWTRHAALRDELSWLWCAHRAAYATSAQPGTAAQWHTMWRAAALKNVKYLTTRLGCEPGMCQKRQTALDPEFNEREAKALDPAVHWLRDGIDRDLAGRPEPADDQQEGEQ